VIDSHCHLNAAEFDGDRSSVLVAARQAGVHCIVNPAVTVANFSTVAAMSAASLLKAQAQQIPYVFYALGIHPLFVPSASPSDIDVLRIAVQQALSDPLFVGIGEIGLDGFVPGLDQGQQNFFFIEQLKIAKEFDLPAIMHVRKAQDGVLKQLRKFKLRSAIAHAFNGSDQQARTFVDLNCMLGFGGAMTFTRALQIRRLAQALPLTSMVIETDSPDISPSWHHPIRNEPAHAIRIGQVLSELRSISLAELERQTDANVRNALPRVAAVY
jgi:TatD DNase family protein